MQPSFLHSLLFPSPTPPLLSFQWLLFFLPISHTYSSLLPYSSSCPLLFMPLFLAHLTVHTHFSFPPHASFSSFFPMPPLSACHTQTFPSLTSCQPVSMVPEVFIIPEQRAKVCPPTRHENHHTCPLPHPPPLHLDATPFPLPF